MRGTRFFIPPAPAGGGGAFTLTAETVSYTTTFTDAALTGPLAALTAETVSYSTSFNAAALTADRNLTAAATSYVTTIYAADLDQDLTLAAFTASYSTAFTDATLTGPAAILTAETVSYSTAFPDAVLASDRNLTAGAVSYTTTLNAANLTASRQLAAAVVTYSTTFVDANLTYTPADSIVAETVTYTTTVNAANLVADRNILAAATSYSTTVNAVNFYYGYRLVAEASSYTTSFSTAGLTAARTLGAGTVTYSTTFSEAALIAGKGSITAETVSYNTTFNDALFDRTSILNMRRGDLVFRDSVWDKNGVQSVDFYFEVSDGGVARHWHDTLETSIEITASGAKTLWPLMNTQEYAFPSAAQPLAVVSSSASDASGGSGAKQIRILGLDGNWDWIEEDVALNGASVVYTLNEFLRVNDVFVISAGSGGVAAGNISVLTTEETPSDFEVGYIQSGKSMSATSAYSIPRNHRYHIKEYHLGYNTKNVGEAKLYYQYTHNPSGVVQTGKEFYATEAQNGTHTHRVLTKPLVGPADLVIKAEKLSGTSVSVATLVDGILVKNFRSS